MQREAEAHADEDRKAKEGIEIRNNADTLAYQCEKQLKDLGDKIDGAKKADVEKEIEKVREALKGSDVEAIKSSYESLQTKFQEISAELYKNAAASGAGAGPEAGAGAAPEPEAKKDADVVDAEFEMVDEDKEKKK
jgi:molecular chaperone DnaK